MNKLEQDDRMLEEVMESVLPSDKETLQKNIKISLDAIDNRL